MDIACSYNDLLNVRPYVDPPAPQNASTGITGYYEPVYNQSSNNLEQFLELPSQPALTPNPYCFDNASPASPRTESLSQQELSSLLLDVPQHFQDEVFPKQALGELAGERCRQPMPNLKSNEVPTCWDHGCNGRVFSSWSNLRRHQRERASLTPKCYCPRCGAYFSRTTARNQHLANMSCTRIRRYSNGRVRPSLLKLQENAK